MLSHMLDCQLCGLRPAGHHATSVILHGFNAVLLFLLFRLITGAFWKSFWLATIFGVHPLRVESVVWISERKDVLSTFFWMLATLAYAAYAKDKIENKRRARCYYGLAIIGFVLGLMSKPMVITLPCVLLLLDYWPLGRWKRGEVFSLFKEKWPFFLLCGLFAGTTFLTQGECMYPLDLMPLDVRMENAFVAYCRYLWKVCYPANLTIFYPYPVHWPVVRVIASVLVLIVISASVFRIRRRHPVLIVGWFWFLGVLFPVIGLMQAGRQSLADRYSYVPSIGILIMIVWGGSHIARRCLIPSRLLSVAVAMIAAICVILTRSQISTWRDNESLWRHAAAVTEKNYVAYGMIGLEELFAHTNYDAAITNLQKALRIRPTELDFANGLGIALKKQGRFDESIDVLQHVISMESTNGPAHREIASALVVKGRRREAITHLSIALSLYPNDQVVLKELCELTNSPSGQQHPTAVQLPAPHR